MSFKSIRFKISVVYMAILALTLSLFSLILYHYVSRNLYDNMDILLRTKADGIVEAVNAYWAAERLGSLRYGARKDDFAKDGDIDFATVAERWVQEKSKDPKLLDIIVQIFDTDGTAVASSKNTQGITSISKENFLLAIGGKTFFDTLSSSFPTKKALKLRVYLTPAVQNEKVEYVVLVASPLGPIQTALTALKITLFILFPITVLLTGMMGAFLAKLTLHPVDNMIKTIHGITAENMKLKLAIPDTKDEIQKLAETFNDMLARLDNAFMTQRKLFEDLSHELKTPLTILKGEFEVFMKRARSAEEYEHLLKSSLEEINKIANLVENLLMLASFESKKILLPQKKELDLNLLVQGVMNSIKGLAAHKQVGLALEQRDNITVSGDEQQLKQLFFNLLDNAIKYTSSGGEVKVSLEESRAMARITIIDTGIGIAREDLDKIFERFYRGDKSNISAGFGLGLNIVKSIADAHGGSVSVESEEGQGTTFTILLPLLSSWKQGTMKIR